jgi:para-aminobenzoate synthetase / 4-amino-4-deoxychorismate lyase
MPTAAAEEDRAAVQPAMRATAVTNPGSVLLETSRFDPSNRNSYLFTSPVNILIARELNEIPQVFAQIESALANGFYVAGYLAYECGHHFEPSTAADFQPSGQPLIWLGVYRQPQIFDHAACPSLASDQPAPNQPATAALNLESIALEIPRPAYQAKIQRIRDYIAAGDTYQVNFTNRVAFETQPTPAETFASLATQQPVAYSAFLNLGDRQILSFSPELFFRIENGKILTRPMKGTMPRGLDAAEDAAASIRLRNDPKNRSEHVMIVDLLRNDLGRICTMGSVDVEQLFTVERYPTLLQMTSAISGALRPNISYYEIFRALFPCGSITGAPKVRTMQIIRELEDQPRGIYTGAIGFIAPNRNSVFNVAIRTLVMENGHASLGVGGGIVADSDPADEYRECLLKASFLTRTRPEFELIETMLWDGSFPLLPLHLQRLESSASYFNFALNRSSIQARLHDLAASFQPTSRHRVRLLLAHDGSLKLTSEPFPHAPPKGLVQLSSQRTSSTEVFFRHKTTQRSLYDQQYAQARASGLDDILFLNEKGELTEGAISNVFLERAGKLLTPPLSCGVLDGVYRRHMLQTRAEAEEQVLTAADLHTADAIYLCNALRGIYKVKLSNPI